MQIRADREFSLKDTELELSAGWPSWEGGAVGVLPSFIHSTNGYRVPALSQAPGGSGEGGCSAVTGTSCQPREGRQLLNN